MNRLSLFARIVSPARQAALFAFRLAMICAVLTAVFSANSSSGANLSWQAVSGNWALATNWSGGALPTPSDSAFVDNGGTAAVATANATAGTLTVGDVAGAGALQISTGTISINNGLFLGYDFGSVGTVTENNASSLLALNEYIGIKEQEASIRLTA